MPPTAGEVCSGVDVSWSWMAKEGIRSVSSSVEESLETFKKAELTPLVFKLYFLDTGAIME
jgi:hypothetical protein